MKNHMVRIGAGCSVDITLALPQMVRAGNIDYLVIDFLTEVAIAGLAAERLGDPEAGFARGFAGPELAAELRQILDGGIRVVTNAGGLNPLGCAAAVTAMADELGLAPRIAVVHGDDVLDQVAGLRAAGRANMYSGAPLPADLVSANAYFGARPIAAALAKGADIVITGRVVDSALTLGPLLHEFGWSIDDYDRLAAGTLTGHLLECGPQPAGGIFTDWREVDWTDSSFPIAECYADGTAVLTKVPDTGGLVSVGTISEQILYEIGDPQRYFMPETTCDVSGVRLEQVGEDRVRVSGARGRPPTGTYKVCAMAQEGWRGVTVGVTTGPDAAEKAERTAEAVLERARRLLRDRNLGAFTATSVELIGSGASSGPRARPGDPREMVYRIAVDHPDKAAIELMLKVARAAGVSMAPGTVGGVANTVAPQMRMHAFVVEKDRVPVRLTYDGRTETVDVPTGGGFETVPVEPVPPLPRATADGGATVPLIRLAWSRSGDKGDISNVGVIARDPDYLPYLSAALTEEAVARWYAHVFARPDAARVERYELPGLNALNFLLHEALDGGAVSSHRFDIMGKGLGQQILDFPVPVPAALAERLGNGGGADRRPTGPASADPTPYSAARGSASRSSSRESRDVRPRM